MNFVDTHEKIYTAKATYFEWFQNTSWVIKASMSVGVALVTGIAAQLRIPLPFTPVPITAQVFTVLLAGVLLGSHYAGLSMIIYLLFGFAGIPWFSNGATGLGLGPTSGYIIGFIPAAFSIGYILQAQAKRKLLFTAIVMVGGVGIIYLCGAVNFALFMNTSIKQTIFMAVLPFIPFDIVKALLAAVCARALLPVQRPKLP